MKKDVQKKQFIHNLFNSEAREQLFVDITVHQAENQTQALHNMKYKC